MFVCSVSVCSALTSSSSLSKTRRVDLMYKYMCFSHQCIQIRVREEMNSHTHALLSHALTSIYAIEAYKNPRTLFTLAHTTTCVTVYLYESAVRRNGIVVMFVHVLQHTNKTVNNTLHLLWEGETRQHRPTTDNYSNRRRKEIQTFNHIRKLRLN